MNFPRPKLNEVGCPKVFNKDVKGYLDQSCKPMKCLFVERFVVL